MRLGESVMAAQRWTGPSSPVTEHAARVRAHVRTAALGVLTSTVLAGLGLAAVLRPGLLTTDLHTQTAGAAAATAILLVNLLLWRAWSVPRVRIDGPRFTDLCRLTVTEILGRQLRWLGVVVPAATLVIIAAWSGPSGAIWFAVPAAAFSASAVLWCTALVHVAARLQIPESKAEAVLGAVMDARTDPAFYEAQDTPGSLEEMTWQEAVSLYVIDDDELGGSE